MSRKHGFVSFTDRVAAIRIDPIRKSEGKRNAPDSNSDSLFLSSLERWNDLNMAAHYTKFSSECSGMVKSLPMVLYNQKKIFDLLEQYTIETDEHSAESLLDLMVNFARDLGEDFEPFYPRALNVCVSLIQKFQKDDSKLEIIEYSFNCLAHLFKYLSRLLTPNLIPTYQVLAPLYGAEKQTKMRAFVLRFAAESMAFLLRRCQRDNLDVIVDHIVKTAANDPTNMQFMDSSSQLLASTVKSSGSTLHSKAELLLQSYVRNCHKHNMVDLINCILVDVLHHARQDTSEVVYKTVVELINEYGDVFSAKMLFVLSGFRKGDRVNDWSAIFEALLTGLDQCSGSTQWILAASTCLAFADLGSSSRNLKPILNKITDLNGLVLLIKVLNENQPEVCNSFHSVISKRLDAVIEASSSNTTSASKITALLYKDTPFEPKNQASVDLEEASLDGYVALWWSLQNVKSLKNGTKLLQKVLKSKLESNSAECVRSIVVALILSKTKEIPEKLLEESSQSVLFTPQFVDALFSTEFKPQDETAMSNLEICLLSSDRKVRSSAIFGLKKMIPVLNESQFVLDEMQTINDLPFDVENSRNISHRMRQLGNKFALGGANVEPLKRIIVCFFFGMLCSRFLPTVKATLEVLPKLAESEPELVSELALRLIKIPEPLYEELKFEDNEFMDVDEPQEVFGLDCHTLNAFEEDLVKIEFEINQIDRTINKRTVKEVKYDFNPEIRIQGIKALIAIPEVAEEHVIAELVPYVLQVNVDENDTGLNFNETSALLELFSKIKTPGKLQQFTELKAKYLYFLASQHTPIQRLGLKCLLTCNSKEIRTLRKYRENFEALLDDKRFRDEITSFICVGDDLMSEGSLHVDDYEVIIGFVVRVLYGRALSGNKRNMRQAVMSSLHFLKPEFLFKFVELAHLHLAESGMLEDDVDYSEYSSNKRVQGYLSLIHDFVKSLQSASMACLPKILESGIIPILERISLKDSKTIRQTITKNLTEMLTSVPVLSVWDPYFPKIYQYLVAPQMTENFGLVNLEHPSTVMRMYIAISGEKELIPLADPEFVMLMVSCLEYPAAKESVIQSVLQLIINLVENGPQSPATQTAVPYALKLLPAQMEKELSSECLALTVQCLNSIFSLGVENFSTKTVSDFSQVSFKALSQPSRLVSLQVKASILLALSKLLSSPSAPIDLINTAYHVLAPLFRQFIARDARLHLCACYRVFAQKNEEYARVAELITELNSFDPHRLGEPDFGRRSKAFEAINEDCWSNLSELEWEPLLFNMMFFIKDPEELALRNNSKYSLLRIIESGNAVNLIKNSLLDGIKKGLRMPDEKFRRLYIDLLAQCAKFDILPNLKVLLFRGDEEADFFVNVNHVQVHRRRRAIQRLGRLASELDESDISFYLLSIVENFALLSGNKNGELNNLADDALQALPLLLTNVSDGQYRSIAKRWVRTTTSEPEPYKLRKNARIVTSVAQASHKGMDEFVARALIQPLHEMLTLKSNEHENLPDRIPLAVAIIYFLMSLQPETIELQLPGKLTTLCQLLRSKIQEMRDTVRQTLGKIAKIVGPQYLRFIMSELYGALRRGGVKAHVLGFTVHSLLVEIERSESLVIGDLDDSAEIIFQVAMNDTFGSVGEEKDDEGYVTQAKEVKQHKSYDTAEILARWTSLSQFGKIVNPIRRYLVSNKVNLKTERKIEELLRRITAGMHKNPQSKTQDAVVMSYEVFMHCQNILNSVVEKSENKEAAKSKMSGSLAARLEAAKESEMFFKVRLSSRDWYDSQNSSEQVDVSVKYATSNLHLLQSFAIEGLRSVMTSTTGGGTTASGKGLLTAANVKGIMPLILAGLQSNHEDLQIASLRLATTALRLPVQLNDGDDTIQVCGMRALEFIESNPGTTNTICQTSLKFLTMLIRTRPEFELNDSAISYLLERLLPDIDEPERQSAVISFIRTLFSRQIMLPEIYTIADKLAEVLVRNQSEATRVNCRHAYLQFLSSFPLGQTRLDRHLANLAANLRYGAPDGRLSVMEMIHLLVDKVQVDQLQSSFIPFFANLALILVTDTEPQCRKRAGKLIKELVQKANRKTKATMIDHCSNWLKSFGKNNMLVRGGLEVAVMFDNLPQDVQTLHNDVVQKVLKSGIRDSDSDDSIDWQLIYLALDADMSSCMPLVEAILLYPHPWVRNKATRVFNAYFKTLKDPENELELLASASRKFVRQLGAPKLSPEDSLNIVKNLVYTIKILETNECKTNNDELYVDWIIRKLSSNVRTDIGSSDLVGGKTGSVQILAAIPAVLEKKTIQNICYEVIRSIYVMIEQLTMENVHEELRELGQEALNVYDKTLGTTEYLQRYTEAKQFVHDKRLERKSKRSIESVTNPEFAARKKMKKNIHKRDSRKLKHKHNH